MADIEKPRPTNSRWANVSVEKGVEDMRLDSSNNDRRSRRSNHTNSSAPTPIQQNSRASLLGGAPEVRPQQLRRERENNSNLREEPRPLPVANSRFARAAESDRDRDIGGERERESYRPRDREPRGPPPTPQNSRFAQAAEADRAERRSNDDQALDRPAERPRVQNSRFAAAAREFEREQQDYQDNRPTPAFRGPPPSVQNSRFAAAAEADMEDRKAYEEVREARMREREDNGGGGSRWGNAQRMDQDRDGSRGGGRYGNRDGNSRFGSRGDTDNTRLPRFPGDRGGAEEALPRFPGDRGSSIKFSSESSSVNALLKPKKAVEKVILPPVSAPLALPGEDEEAARTRIEKKKREEQERKQKEVDEARLAVEKKVEEERLAKEEAERAMAAEGDILKQFSSGEKVGAELAVWCKDQGSLLPSVEKLLFYYLKEVEANNPDKDCGWASKERLGAALLSLVSDNVLAQAQILFAIQKYCDWTGFPKCGNEYLVQSMFTNMYKYDLAEADAFDYWKEDESDEHEVGKQKTLVQTIDWFIWLEEDDEEEYEEEYEY